jgi:hypothetical protein
MEHLVRSVEQAMFSRHREAERETRERAIAFDDFHDWVLSLPWVVERPYGLGTPGVRSFGIDCEPLGRRQLWLLTGLRSRLDPRGIGLAVILPTDEAIELQGAGRGRSLSPMPGRQMLVSMNGDNFDRRDEVEALVLTAYGCAMS